MKILAFPRFLAAALLLGLGACAGDGENLAEPPALPSADEYYRQGLGHLRGEDTKAAAQSFEDLEREYPYSTLAAKAQLNAAYAYYEAADYVQTIATLDRFIQLHPGHPRIDYAYYLRAIALYERINDVRRDQTITENARQALSEVMSRFPETAYARDARIKIDFITSHLTGRDMEVGRYYQKQKMYQAAINRYQSVVDSKQTTAHTPEALLRLVECYLALGLPEEAQRVAAVLGHNYPGSTWYESAFDLMKDHAPGTK